MIVTKIHEFSGHKDSIYTSAIDTSTLQCYTAGGDGMVVAWDGINGGDGSVVVRVGTAIYCMCQYKSRLLLGNRTGNLYIIDLITKKEERNVEAHTQGIFDIVYHEEAHCIYTCGFDGFFNVWDEDFNLLYRTKLSDKSLRSICLLPASIAVASSDGVVYILDGTTGKVTSELKGHQNSVFTLAYNPLKKELLSGGRDCYLKIWDTQSWQLKNEYVAATLHINHIRFNPEYSLYAVSSMDKTIKIVDANSHEPLKFITKEKDNGHSSSINKTLWLGNKSFFSVSDDKKAMCWSLK